MPRDTMVSPDDSLTLGGGGGGPSGGGPSWVSTHKGAAIGLGLVGAFALYMFLKNRNSSASGATSPLTPGGIGTTTGPSVYEIAPPTDQGYYNPPIPSGTTTTSSGSSGNASWTAPTNAQQIGGGFWEPGSGATPVTNSQGQQYLYVSNPEVLTTLKMSNPNAQQYVQTAPGVFNAQPIGTPDPANTPIYEQVS